MRTPWGNSDHKQEYGPGITFYGTPRHGGFKVNKKQNQQIPEYMRSEDGWYEEDCGWSIVAVIHCDRFPPKEMLQAWNTLKNWYPEFYQRLTGVTLRPEESYTLRKAA